MKSYLKPSEDRTYSEMDLKLSSGSLSDNGQPLSPDCAAECRTLQCKYLALCSEYEKEKSTRLEAETAFYKMMEMYEEKRKDFELFEGAIERHRKAFEMAAQVKEQYCELAKITEKKTNQLTEANDTIYILKRNIAQNKQKMQQMKAEIDFLKQPGEHSKCDQLLEQETQEKEDALEKMAEMCDEMRDIKDKSEMVKRTNREMKEKMAEIVAIKNELVKQNETLLFQVDTMQDILANKDEQIEELVKRDFMDEPAVQYKLAEIGKAHDVEIEEWQSKVDNLNKEIATLNADKTEMKQQVEKRISEMEETCKTKHVLKEDYDKLDKKLRNELAAKEQDLLKLLDAFKANKTKLLALVQTSNKELAKLKEEIREKDVEIVVLTEAKRRYEELIKEKSDKDKDNGDDEEEDEEEEETDDEEESSETM